MMGSVPIAGEVLPLPTVNPTKCRSCPAQIVYATTVNGKLMPVDAAPVPDGMLELYWSDEILRVRVVPKASREVTRKRVGGLYRAHFASCPKAAVHRKTKTATS